MLSLLARPLLAAPFIMGGVDALRRPAAHRAAANRTLETLEKLGVPPLPVDTVTRASGAVVTVAGLCLARGKMPRAAALALGAMQIPLAISRNPFWLEEGAQRRASLQRLVTEAGLVGGALIAVSDRGGKPSLTWRASNWAKSTTNQ